MSEWRDSGEAGLIVPASGVVTTAEAAGEADVKEARAEALRLGLPFVSRDRRGLRRVFERSGAGVVLVVGEREASAWVAGHRAPLRFHGGIGVLRAKAVAAGRPDALVDACGLGRGDVVVDATAGRCSDALVAEAAVGPGGRVVALESSPLVHAVMARGLRCSGARVELLQADHLAWLRAQPDRSVDVVYFDPMFRAPARAAKDFEVFRALAERRPVDRTVLEEAMRVARRRVVLADAADGALLRRLQLRDVSARWSSRRYGALETGPAIAEAEAVEAAGSHGSGRGPA